MDYLYRSIQGKWAVGGMWIKVSAFPNIFQIKYSIIIDVASECVMWNECEGMHE